MHRAALNAGMITETLGITPSYNAHVEPEIHPLKGGLLLLYSIYVRFWFFSLAALTVGFLIFAHQLGRKWPTAWRISRFMARLFLLLCGIWVRKRGFENIPRKGPTLLIANHQSFLDQFILYAVLPTPYHPVISFPVPIGVDQIHRIFQLAGFIEIRPGNRQSVEAGIQKIADTLAENKLVLMLPEENPTTVPGKVRRFKRGCGSVLLKQHAPIVLIQLTNTLSLTANAGYFSPGVVTCNISKPLKIEIHAGEEEFKESCRIADTLRLQFAKEFKMDLA